MHLAKAFNENKRVGEGTTWKWAQSHKASNELNCAQSHLIMGQLEKNTRYFSSKPQGTEYAKKTTSHYCDTVPLSLFLFIQYKKSSWLLPLSLDHGAVRISLKKTMLEIRFRRIIDVNFIFIISCSVIDKKKQSRISDCMWCTKKQTNTNKPVVADSTVHKWCLIC